MQKLAMTGGGINSEVGVASVTSFIPLGKFNVDFVFRVRADVVRGAIAEQTEHGRRIHGVHVALDDPLVGSEAQVLSCE